MKSRTLAGSLAISVAMLAGQTIAQEGESLFGLDTASVTYGAYVRGEVGLSNPDEDDAFWDPPGRSDPRISFDADMDNATFGALAFGYDWQNGFRGEIALNFFADADVKAPCSSASDGSPCSTHADITDTSVKTRAFMANVYYSPLEAAGNNARFQPFLTAGIGSARNEMSDWTRVNPASGRPVRVFEGDRNTDFAWSVGAGIAYEPDWGIDYPIIVEATYRYFDLGTASGSSMPLPGNGSGEPREPFQFDNRAHVVSVGLRIPLQRY